MLISMEFIAKNTKIQHRLFSKINDQVTQLPWMVAVKW